MPKVQYVGDSDVRIVRAKDFSNNGFEGQKQVKWDRSNRFVAEVDSAEAAQFLADHTGLGGAVEFRVLPDDEEPKGASGAERKTGTHQAKGKRKPGTASEVSASAGTAPRTDTRTGSPNT